MEELIAKGNTEPQRYMNDIIIFLLFFNSLNFKPNILVIEKQGF